VEFSTAFATAVNHRIGGWNTVDFGGCISGSEHRTHHQFYSISLHYVLPMSRSGIFRLLLSRPTAGLKDEGHRTLITGWVGCPGSHWLTDWMPQWMNEWVKPRPCSHGGWSPTDARWNRIIIIAAPGEF